MTGLETTFYYVAILVSDIIITNTHRPFRSVHTTVYTCIVISVEMVHVSLLQKDQVSACDNHQPFLSVGEDLKNILNGVCELMAVQAVTAKVHNGSDLQSVLEQNIIDSCHWVSSADYLYSLTLTKSVSYVQ